MWVIILILIIFQNNCEKNHTCYLFFIDNGKGTPHLKFAPLDYGNSDVFTFENVKQLETQHCSLHQGFVLKLVYQKLFECDLDI